MQRLAARAILSHRFFFVLMVGAVLFSFQPPVHGQEKTRSAATVKFGTILIPYSMHLDDNLNYQSKPASHYMDILTIGLEKDGNLSMRIEAASILGRYKAKQAIELLHKTLMTTTHPALRTQCIDALARINDDLSVMYIENALKDRGPGGELDGKPFVESGLKLREETIAQDKAKNPNSRTEIQFPKVEEYLALKKTASWVLGLMGRNRSIIVLADVLNDKDLEVKVNAAYALGDIANPGVELGKKSSTVEDHIEDIIKKFNDEKNDDQFRIALAYPMLKLRKNERKGFYFLAKSLLSDNDVTRALAAKILARLHDIRGLSPLEDAIARERSPWVEIEMANGIKQIKIFNQSYR